jgi:hypothetical protein
MTHCHFLLPITSCHPPNTTKSKAKSSDIGRDERGPAQVVRDPTRPRETRLPSSEAWDQLNRAKVPLI